MVFIQKASLVISALLLVFTYYVDEEFIFERFFSKDFRASISGFMELHNFYDLEKNEYGFEQVLTMLDAQIATGSIEKIRNSLTVGSWPYEEVTYEFIGTNELGEKEKKLGEVTRSKEALPYIAELKFKTPYKSPFATFRYTLQFLSSLLVIVALGIQVWKPATTSRTLPI